MDYGSGSSSTPTWDSGFVVDAALTSDKYFASRLTGTKRLYTNSSNSEGDSGYLTWDSNLGWGYAYGSGDLAYMFKRAPGFMDAVAYTGNGTSQALNHNLSVTPELMFVKIRSGADNWSVYHKDLGATKYLKLNENHAAATAIGPWQNTAPTSTVFTVGGDVMVNANTHTYIAYLFATLPGISKVGSYTGNGTDQTIDCGFTNGARFVMIKRTNATADWFIWDSTRGIVSGNDPYIVLNNSAAQVTNTDYIDPHSSGFTLTAAAATVNGMYNYNGNPYIFLAIA
jgi:hypothetical protein